MDTDVRDIDVVLYALWNFVLTKGNFLRPTEHVLARVSGNVSLLELWA